MKDEKIIVENNLEIKFIESIKKLGNKLNELYPSAQPKIWSNLCAVTQDIVYFAKEITTYKNQIKNLKLVNIEDVNSWPVDEKTKEAWKKLIYDYGPLYLDQEPTQKLRYAIENFSYRVASFQDEIIKRIDVGGDFLLMDPSENQREVPTSFLSKYKKSLRRYLFNELTDIFTILENKDGIKEIINYRHKFAHRSRLNLRVEHKGGQKELKIYEGHFKQINSAEFFRKIRNSINDITNLISLTESLKSKNNYLNALKARYKYNFRSRKDKL